MRTLIIKYCKRCNVFNANKIPKEKFFLSIMNHVSTNSNAEFLHTGRIIVFQNKLIEKIKSLKNEV